MYVQEGVLLPSIKANPLIVVSNLASLFQEMITSPDGSITPKQELARLTLESKGAVDKVRRRSTIASGGRPSLGNIDSMPILGPVGPPDDVNGVLGEEALQTESPAVENPADPFADPMPDAVGDQKDISNNKAHSSDDLEMIDAGDNSSDVTLVSNVSMADSNGGASAIRAQQQNILDNKENLLPSTAGEGIRRSTSPDKHLHPLAEASESDINAQAGALAPPVEVLTDGFVKPESEILVKPETEIPKKPPPVPPRPQVKQKQEAEKAVIETYAQQQDVTEVIGHCLYQFSLAIRPLGQDQDGEQLDEIHNLFYGKQVTKLVPEDASRNKYELFSNILTRVGPKPTDIYAALDGYFDVEEVEGAKRYISIVDLPPILAIQLDRVEYDTETHRAKKNNGHVQLMETIYLDRYLDEPVDSALMERRQQTWTMKKDLARMSARMEDLKAHEVH
jgi:ubiquitin carboxyl-terminal hydrolase 25/28